MKTLRQHAEEAERIKSIGGVKTLIPQKGLPAPVRQDASNAQLEYATDISTIIDRYDRTGYAGDYLRASDEAASTVWHSIPEHTVCPLCLGRVAKDRAAKGRVWCRPCDTYVWPKNLRGLVSADIRSMRAALNAGGIRCRAEKGERG